MQDEDKDNWVIRTDEMPDYYAEYLESRIVDVTKEMMSFHVKDEPAHVFFGVLIAGFCSVFKSYIREDVSLSVRKDAVAKMVHCVQKNMESLIEEWEKNENG